MKVLKRVEKTYQFTCSKCGSELEAEATDLKYRSWETGDYDSSECYFVCEVCKQEHKDTNGQLFSSAAYAEARVRFRNPLVLTTRTFFVKTV